MKNLKTVASLKKVTFYRNVISSFYWLCEMPYKVKSSIQDRLYDVEFITKSAGMKF